MHTQAPNVLFPATNMSIEKWYNKAACGQWGFHYRTNELSPWRSDLSANGASRPRAGGGGGAAWWRRGSWAPGSARRPLPTRGRRAALNTGESSLKCHFWPICSSVWKGANRRARCHHGGNDFHPSPSAGRWQQQVFTEGSFRRRRMEALISLHVHVRQVISPTKLLLIGSRGPRGNPSQHATQRNAGCNSPSQHSDTEGRAQAPLHGRTAGSRRFQLWNLAHSFCQVFSGGLRAFHDQIRSLLLVTKTGGDRRELPSKAPKEEDIHEETMSPAGATEMSVDAAIVEVLAELDGVFTIKEER